MSLHALVSLSERTSDQWGLITTAQAAALGVSRQQLSELTEVGALERIEQGVYRATAAPSSIQELTHATWLALGGAEYTWPDVPPVVAAGETAAIMHGIGDFMPDGYDFYSARRRGTRLPGVRIKTRTLTREEIGSSEEGMPVLSVERTIADLVERLVDTSLVARALAQAAERGKITSVPQLVKFLAPLAANNGMPAGDGAALARELYEIAGLTVPAALAGAADE
ncbi:Uncharacterised protein [Mycobacteroides abscessus subsp. abscessus]|nr:Uncharacterised protein [Mycobacteroides abscessus subsp. abscessus]